MKQTTITPIKAKPGPFHGEEILCTEALLDRKSVFVAHAARASTFDEARQFRAHIAKSVAESHPSDADHEIAAWRVLAPTHDSPADPAHATYIAKTGFEDDGERFGGSCIGRVLEARNAVDVVVVVSRWYGGEMLGPVRFQHIGALAAEALDLYVANERSKRILARIAALDAEISAFSSRPPAPKPGLSEEALARVLNARTKRLDWLRSENEKSNRPDPDSSGPLPKKQRT